MQIAFIASLKDKASLNIKENLISNFDFKCSEEKFDNNNVYCTMIGYEDTRLYTLSSDLIDAEEIDKSIEADLFVFISRHQSKEERKSLTAHIPGNFGKADFGGKEKTLCYAPATLLKNIFIELSKNAENSGYEASLEVTHHGPYLERPALFIEIGTTEKEWEDKEAGKIIAETLVSTIKKYNNNVFPNNKKTGNKDHDSSIKIEGDKKNFYDNTYESVFVIGGSHYNYIANKVMLNSDYAAGHVCAKYNLENLDLELIRQAMEKTVPKAKFVLLDWKGMGKEKQNILKLLNNSKIVYKRSDKFF
jgi:D-aminoacyl-tRNA deacylase